MSAEICKLNVLAGFLLHAYCLKVCVCFNTLQYTIQFDTAMKGSSAQSYKSTRKPSPEVAPTTLTILLADLGRNASSLVFRI